MHSGLNLLYQLYIFFHFTDKKFQRYTDDDSGMGSSLFTDTKSTTFSEVSYIPVATLSKCMQCHMTCIFLFPF